MFLSTPMLLLASVKALWLCFYHHYKKSKYLQAPLGFLSVGGAVCVTYRNLTAPALRGLEAVLEFDASYIVTLVPTSADAHAQDLKNVIVIKIAGFPLRGPP